MGELGNASFFPSYVSKTPDSRPFREICLNHFCCWLYVDYLLEQNMVLIVDMSKNSFATKTALRFVVKTNYSLVDIDVYCFEHVVQ